MAAGAPVVNVPFVGAMGTPVVPVAIGAGAVVRMVWVGTWICPSEIWD